MRGSLLRSNILTLIFAVNNFLVCHLAMSDGAAIPPKDISSQFIFVNEGVVTYKSGPFKGQSLMLGEGSGTFYQENGKTYFQAEKTNPEFARVQEIQPRQVVPSNNKAITRDGVNIDPVPNGGTVMKGSGGKFYVVTPLKQQGQPHTQATHQPPAQRGGFVQHGLSPQGVTQAQIDLSQSQAQQSF